MSGNPPIELETDEQVLAFTLDVVIPAMRRMEFRDTRQDLRPGAPQVCFKDWIDDSGVHLIIIGDPEIKKWMFRSQETCGTFGCLGGWLDRLSGKARLHHRLHDACERRGILDICSAVHTFSKGGTAREELEARAAAIAKVLGR